MASKYDSTLVKVFDNEVVEVVLEDQLMTKLDMMQFAHVNTELAENPGMTKVIRRYAGTGDVEEVEMGAGNTTTMGVGFTEAEYTVGTTQGRFQFYDEQLMNDPDAIDKMARYLSEQMINDNTKKIVAELGKTPYVVAGVAGFDIIADAIAEFPKEDTEDEGTFLLVNRKDVALWRKALKDSLEYTEAFVRTGYIGTVCGVPMYMTDAVPQGAAYLATREAVTVFVKKGSEVERERDANIRSNTVYGRKVALVALTDPEKAVQIAYGTGTATAAVTWAYSTPTGGELTTNGTKVTVTAPSGPVGITLTLNSTAQNFEFIGDGVSAGGTADDKKFNISINQAGVYSCIITEDGKSPLAYNITVGISA